MTQKDLVVLVADKDAEQAIRALLQRGPSMAMRNVSSDVFVHPERDPGCRSRGVAFLRSFARQYRNALLVFDLEGCGREDPGREALEAELEDELARNGWQQRAAVIILQPELEIWVWSDSPILDRIVGWRDRQPALRKWLEDRGFLKQDDTKPTRPKEALDAALRQVQQRHSSSIFFQLASEIGLSRCTDPAFDKFKTLMRKWFPGF